MAMISTSTGDADSSKLYLGINEFCEYIEPLAGFRIHI